MPNQTPLYARHVDAGGRIVDFSGWSLPVQYTGIIEEHHATRTAATLFDTCHMSRLRIDGPDAAPFLEHLLTVPVAQMVSGQCRYGFLLNPDGGVLDDLILYRLTDQDWMLVANAGTHDKDVAWIRAHAPSSVDVRDVSTALAKLDIQGPRSDTILAAALGVDVPALRYFRCATIRWHGAALVLSRTGYTGERGYELYPRAEHVADLWDALIEADAKPAGLGARDTLRLEAGLPLYGHELDEAHTPVHSGLDRFTSKAADYIGRAAVEKARLDARSERLVGFRCDGRRSARHGDAVHGDERVVGTVTSGSFAPTRGVAVGMAFVAPDATAPGTPLTIGNGRRAISGTVVTLPFYHRSKPQA